MAKNKSGQLLNEKGYLMVQDNPYSEGITHLDSAHNKSSVLNRSRFAVSEGNHLFTNEVDKMAVLRLNGEFALNNVNPRNYTISFVSSNTGAAIHTVNLAEGFYTTRATLMTALVTALNTLTGTTGLTFSHTVSLNNALTHDLTSAGGSYYFTSSNLITYGKYLYNIPQSQTLQTVKVVGPIYGHYTRYLDFVSDDITSSKRVGSNSTSERSSQNLLFRHFLPKLGKHEDDVKFEILIPRWIDKAKARVVTYMSIHIHDEFGNDVYFPSFDSGTSTWYDISVISR